MINGEQNEDAGRLPHHKRANTDKTLRWRDARHALCFSVAACLGLSASGAEPPGNVQRLGPAVLSTSASVSCHSSLTGKNVQATLAALPQSQPLSTVVQATIPLSGALQDVSTAVSSGSAEFDELAKHAVEAARCQPVFVGDHLPVQAQAGFVFSTGGGADEHAAAPAVHRTTPTAMGTSLPLVLFLAPDDYWLRRVSSTTTPQTAEVIRRWTLAFTEDPEVKQFVIANANGTRSVARTPLATTFSELDAMRTLSQGERTRLWALVTDIFEKGANGCPHLKSLPAVITQSFIKTLTADQLDDYLRLNFSMLKKTVRHASQAQVSDAQRWRGEQAIRHTLTTQISTHPEDRDDLAALVANDPQISDAQWCHATQLLRAAIQETPQPYRDWAIVGQTPHVVLAEGISSVSVMQATASPGVANGYANAVRKRVLPNLDRGSSIKEQQVTVVTIENLDDGRVLSVTLRLSSGDPQSDEAALRAVIASDPIPTDVNGKAQRKMNLRLARGLL